MPETYYVVPEAVHNRLVETAYRRRGYDAEEAADAARLCASASAHGIRTHNALKGLHLDHLFGSAVGGCRPGATIRELPHRFTAARVWDAGRKPGPTVAYRAIEACIRLADEHGVGMVSVDNCFHYLWGGGYALEAARRGYLAYTCCTALLAEVVPFGGRTPTLGTNPHTWAFPTQGAVGFPILVDWATSTIAMGRVQQLEREGKPLPPNVAVDAEGRPTIDPSRAVALLPFGAHKGYGLSLVNELLAAFVGGSLPTLRGRTADDGRKHSPVFFFQVVHPEAVSGGAFAGGRSQPENVKAVLRDVLGHGNDGCLLPGQVEAEAAALTARHGGLLFTLAEMEAFAEVARECGEEPWDPARFRTVTA